MLSVFYDAFLWLDQCRLQGFANLLLFGIKDHVLKFCHNIGPFCINKKRLDVNNRFMTDESNSQRERENESWTRFI